MGELLWRLGNKIRSWFGRPALPRPCCRKEANLGQSILVDVTPNGILMYRRCAVCKARHFEMNAEPGKFGLRGF